MPRSPMGIALIHAAEVWSFPTLGHNQAAKVALITMARIARDKDEPPWYGLGFEPIARALGYGDDEIARQRVSRVMRVLVDAKLVERVYTTPDGRRLGRSNRACWILKVGP